jgi:membrane-associated phospholipid phosphatase
MAYPSPNAPNPMNDLRFWAYGLVLTAAATIVCYAFVDVPLALFAHGHLREYAIFARLTTATEYFPPIAIAAIFVLGLWRLSGRAFGYSAEAILITSVSLVAARAAKDQLKLVFGRTWPETWTNNNPSLIKDGAFGFHPFHGGSGFESFPSGHTLGICAVVTALWFYYPRYTPIYVVLILAVSIALIGANYHFLSDIIAGGFIGATLAILCVKLFAQSLSSHDTPKIKS